MATGFRFRGGSTKGINPKKTPNNQDSFWIEEADIGGSIYHIGFLADGCTGNRKTSRTETGSNLLTRFAVSEVKLLLASGIALEDIAAPLYARCVGFIQSIVRQTLATATPDEYWSFISDNFLATLFGAIRSPTETLLLSSGDGVIAVDDRVEILDMNDEALYLAYHLLDRQALMKAGLEDSLPTSFEGQLLKNDRFRNFAIASDGIVMRDGRKKFLADGFLNGCWNHKAHLRNGLNMFLNGQQLQLDCFPDDATVVASNYFEIQESQ